jgi:fatty acid-binding protein DegV
MTHFSNRPGEGDQLRELVAERFKCAEIYTSEYSPVMCSATGPMVGISFYT